MTTQIPDSCMIDGRRWVIESWNGDHACVPPNESLGFRTVSKATNNWAGRIDHFLLHHDRLMLFRVEVNLPEEDAGLLPFGARREVVLRYDQMEVHDNRGMRMEQRERRLEYLVFDDLHIPFTGTLHLSFPYFDYWEVPWPIDDEEDATTEEIVVEFEEGRVMGRE